MHRDENEAWTLLSPAKRAIKHIIDGSESSSLIENLSDEMRFIISSIEKQQCTD